MELFNGSFYDGALTVCFTILGVHLVLISIFAVYQTIRHKTQHPKFMIGIPAIMVAQAILAGFIVWLRFF